MTIGNKRIGAGKILLLNFRIPTLMPRVAPETVRGLLALIFFCAYDAGEVVVKLQKPFLVLLVVADDVLLVFNVKLTFIKDRPIQSL